MSSSTLAGALFAELALGLFPSAILMGIAVLFFRRDAVGRRLSARLRSDAAKPVAFAGVLRPRQILIRAFITGVTIEVATLLPVPFFVVVILGSLAFALAMAMWAWRCIDGISGAFFAVTGAMLGATGMESTITFLTLWSEHATTNSPAVILLTMWALFAFPGLIFGLVGGWMAGTLDREYEAKSLEEPAKTAWSSAVPRARAYPFQQPPMPLLHGEAPGGRPARCE